MIEDYAAYLKSDKWAKKRQEAFKAKGRSCQACKNPETLHVHHRTYERLGEEEMQDLVILCQACHSLVHKAEKELDLKIFHGDRNARLKRATYYVTSHTVASKTKKKKSTSPRPAKPIVRSSNRQPIKKTKQNKYEYDHLVNACRTVVQIDEMLAELENVRTTLMLKRKRLTKN